MLIEHSLGYKYIVDDSAFAQMQQDISAFASGHFAPVVLDIISTSFEVANLPILIELFAQKQLVVIGVITEREDIKEYATLSNLALVPHTSNAEHPKHLFINKPSIIRNDIKKNEQIYAKNTDLIVLGDVLDKAEAISDKNIYIYGGSYGKIFAGIKANTEAKIFAHFFASKLVCIAGVYREFDLVPAEYYNKSVEISLVGDALEFRVLV